MNILEKCKALNYVSNEKFGKQYLNKKEADQFLSSIEALITEAVETDHFGTDKKKTDTTKEIDKEKINLSIDDIKNKNILFLDNQFKELGIELTSDELVYLEKLFVMKGKCMGLGAIERDTNKMTSIPLINQDNSINEEVCKEFQNVSTKTYRGCGSINHLVRKFQNITNSYVPEKKYSIEKNNQIGTFFREYNKLFEDIEKSFSKFNQNRNTGVRLTDSYRFCEHIKDIVKKEFGIGDDHTDLVGCVTDRNYIKYFFNNETYITNSKLFWIVFSVVWKFSNFNEIHYQQWSEVFSRYGRLDGGFIDRIHLSYGKIYADSIRDVLRQYNSDDFITVYRGFLVRKNHFVRKGILKNNNPNHFIQDEGKGYSYSLDKQQGIRFGCRYHFNSDFNIRKSLPTLFGDLSNRKIEKQLSNEYKSKLRDFYNQNYLEKETRRCVGTFKIKKKDIIFGDCIESESEIIIDSNNVQLVRYDFINDEIDNLSAVENYKRQYLFTESHLRPTKIKLSRDNDI